MIKKTKGKLFIGLLLSCCFIVSLFYGCSKTEESIMPVNSYDTEMLSLNSNTNGELDYNSNLFYINTLEFNVADPSLIYITEGEDAGYFYVYGTSDDVQTKAIQSWRSKDLTHWESMGIAFFPDYSVTWGTSSYFAPEVIYDDTLGLYFMCYNATSAITGNACLSIAYSSHPAGPFVNPDGRKNAYGETLTPALPVYDFSQNNDRVDPALARSSTIDASLFVDPVSGELYLYFCYYDSLDTTKKSEIFGCKMIDWFTPDYSTLKQLTALNYITVDAAMKDAAGENFDTSLKIDTESRLNEAPFMYYHEGKYYLTFSINSYRNAEYQVRQAIADSPLGDFEKVRMEDGGAVLSTDPSWTHIMSAGHHSFFTCGDEMFVAYHTFYNRVTIEEGRSLAVDRVSFIENNKGETILYTNGPTYSLQPLPSEVSGYKNIGPDAEVSASNTARGSQIGYLTDGVIKTRDSDQAIEYTANEGVSEITFSWEDFKTAKAVLIYNSYDYDQTFVQVDKIEINYLSGDNQISTAVISNLPFDWDWHADMSLERMKPGGASIAEFNEIAVKEIKITIRSVAGSGLSIPEIVILGKDEACDAVTEFEDYSYTNPAYPSPEITNISSVFGDVGNLKTTYGYDLSHDNGTSERYIDQKGPSSQYAYFKDIEHTQTYVEAMFTVTQSDPFLGDNYPKFGIVIACEENTLFFYVNANSTYSRQQVGCAQRTLDNSNWDWQATEQIYNVDGMEYSNGSYVKIGVLRQGADFYMFVNDTLVFQYDNFSVFTDRQEATCGFLSFNTPLRIVNYYATQNETEIEAKLEALIA